MDISGRKFLLYFEPHIEVDPWAHLNLVWKPLLRAIIPRGDTGGHHNPVRVSILPIAPDGSLRNEYFLGTEDGDILYGGIKLVKDGDSGKMVAPRPLWIGKGHSIHIRIKFKIRSI